MTELPEDYKTTMSHFRLGIFKTGFWLTAILVILKITHAIEINDWMVFLPLMIAFGLVFLVIFIIGLMTVYLLAKEEVEKEKEDEEGSSDE